MRTFANFAPIRKPVDLQQISTDCHLRSRRISNLRRRRKKHVVTQILVRRSNENKCKYILDSSKYQNTGSIARGNTIVREGGDNGCRGHMPALACPLVTYNTTMHSGEKTLLVTYNTTLLSGEKPSLLHTTLHCYVTKHCNTPQHIKMPPFSHSSGDPFHRTG